MFSNKNNGKSMPLRRFLDCAGEFLLDDLVVGAYGDGGEVYVPDGVVGVGDGGNGGRVLPLVVDGPHPHVAQHAARHPQQRPEHLLARRPVRSSQ